MAVNLGSSNISTIKLGATDVSKIYLGSELIFGGEFSPLDLSPSCWYQSDYGVTYSGSNLISDWLDRSGNNKHFQQNSAALQPTYIDSDANFGELPVVSILLGDYFNILNGGVEITANDNSGVFVWYVQDITGQTFSPPFSTSISSISYFGLRQSASGGLIRYNMGGFDRSVGLAAPNIEIVFGFISNVDGVWKGYLNTLSGAIFTAPASSPSLFTTQTLNYFGRTGSTVRGIGKMAEIGILDYCPTLEQINNLGQYLSAKWSRPYVDGTFDI